MMKILFPACWGLGLMVLAAGCSGNQDQAAVDRAVDRAESAVRLMPPAEEDQLLAAEAGLPTADRIGRWARRFLAT